MILKRTSLSRRKVLRGAGASLALPLLEAMQVSSFSKTNEAVKPPVRAGFFYIPNGVVQTAWHPKDTGKGYELSPTLEPIRPIKNDVTLFTKLDRVKIILGGLCPPRPSQESQDLCCSRRSHNGATAAAPAAEFYYFSLPTLSFELGVVQT